jgi:hypothetical protein
MDFGTNLRLKRLYSPGGRTIILLETIDLLLEILLLSLKAAIKELRKVLYFSSS